MEHRPQQHSTSAEEKLARQGNRQLRDKFVREGSLAPEEQGILAEHRLDLYQRLSHYRRLLADKDEENRQLRAALALHSRVTDEGEDRIRQSWVLIERAAELLDVESRRGGRRFLLTQAICQCAEALEALDEEVRMRADRPRIL